MPPTVNSLAERILKDHCGPHYKHLSVEESTLLRDAIPISSRDALIGIYYNVVGKLDLSVSVTVLGVVIMEGDGNPLFISYEEMQGAEPANSAGLESGKEIKEEWSMRQEVRIRLCDGSARDVLIAGTTDQGHLYMLNFSRFLNKVIWWDKKLRG